MTGLSGRYPGDRGVAISDFDRWVGENNIPRTFEVSPITSTPMTFA